MAKAMPKAYAKPIWSIDPNAGSASFRMKDAVAAIPGYTGRGCQQIFLFLQRDVWDKP